MRIDVYLAEVCAEMIFNQLYVSLAKVLPVAFFDGINLCLKEEASRYGLRNLLRDVQKSFDICYVVLGRRGFDRIENEADRVRRCRMLPGNFAMFIEQGTQSGGINNDDPRFKYFIRVIDLNVCDIFFISRVEVFGAIFGDHRWIGGFDRVARFYDPI